MSIRGRDHQQAKPQSKSDPLPGQPAINYYNPARAVACEIVGVPYGEIAVGGLPAHVHSHEMNFGLGGFSVFLDPRECREQRDGRKARRDAVSEAEAERERQSRQAYA